jgi:6-phosphogluconolactonase
MTAAAPAPKKPGVSSAGDGLEAMKPRVFVGDLPQLRVTFAKEFETQAKGVIARREKCIIALPGGSVASAFFPTLATLAVDWTRMEVFWIDERAVPPDHPDSNVGLASRLLLVPARVPPARIHRMHGELPDLDQAARRATDELKSIAGDPPHVDLAIVGVGDDGHVASIFPSRLGARADSSADLPTEARGAKVGASGAKVDQPVIAVYDSPKPPARRLTLTLAVLANAGLVIVAAFGASKAEAMRGALDQSNAATPVAELLRRAPSSLVLLDREAGLS